jgi:NurA-like 5'-3' nuclease
MKEQRSTNIAFGRRPCQQDRAVTGCDIARPHHQRASVGTDVSEDRTAFITRVSIIGKSGTKLTVSSNRRRLNGIISQKMAFFIVTAVET